MVSGKGENLGEESWRGIKERGMNHPVNGVKLKSHGNFPGPFAPWVGKESSWDLKQPKTIQPNFGLYISYTYTYIPISPPSC